MDEKIEIKEEDLLTDDITSQNEREFFQKVVSIKTSTDAVLLDTDCDMTVKTEIQPETPFIRHFVKQIKTETASCSNSWEMDRTNEVKQQPLFSDVASQNKEELHQEHPVIMDKKYNSDIEMCNKIEFIEIKEEPWQLETETSSVCGNTKDVDLPAVKPSRFSPETVAAAIVQSQLLSAELQARETSLYVGKDHFEFEYQKSDVSEVINAKENVHSEKYGKCCDEGDMHIQSLNLNPKSLDNLGKGPQQCSICAKTFTCLLNLKVHMLIHEGKKRHHCKVCDKRFTRLSHLKTHQLIHKGKKPHQCKVCDKSFTQLSTLNTHRLIHEGNKAHQCKVCDKRFTRLSHLEAHHLIHEGRKPHQCKVCDKSFTQLSTLKTHQLIHEGKKPHQCKICEKNFTQLSSLKTHQLIHEGKKPYQCELCDRSFTQLSSVRTHQLIHKSKKPHQCKVCAKTFTDLSTLETHQLIHESEKPHRCKVYDKSFTQLSTLKRHKLVHGGKKFQQCEVCDKSFTRLLDLKTHTLIHEGSNKAHQSLG